MRLEPLAAESCRRRLAADPAQRYWVYAPKSALALGARAPLWVSVHGISRNAGAHLRSLAPWAERLGCVLLAPHFSRARFPDYQRFGRPGRLGPGGRADARVLEIVSEVRVLLNLSPAPLFLLGHSGGAQFVQRFVLAHGEHVARYVLSAPGSYAWPDETRRFPLGAGQSPRFPDLRPRLKHLLRTPVLVTVGQGDQERDETLRQGKRVDHEQGRTRRERAERFVDRLMQLASEQGLPSPATLAVLPGSGHAFSEVMARGGWQRWRPSTCLAGRW